MQWRAVITSQVPDRDATLGLAVRHNAAESWGDLRKRSSEAKKMQSSVLVAFLLTFVLAHEEPETKELLVFRRKINLVNNVLHGTVRKILRPYKNKIPRTFTKNTRVHHGNFDIQLLKLDISENTPAQVIVKVIHYHPKYTGKQLKTYHDHTQRSSVIEMTSTLFPFL